MIRKKKLDVVRGGIAIPIPNKDNYYYMSGRKHINGGIDLGKDPKTGLEVEDGEVVKIGKNNIKVFSAVPFLNGKSPAQKVLGGENPNTVFKQQESFKDRNGINDDGTKKKAFFGINENENEGLIDKAKNISKDDIDKINNSWLATGAKFFDPTGITSWYDVKRAIDDYKENPKNPMNSINLTTEIIGAVPVIGKVAKGVKAMKAVKKAVKGKPLTDAEKALVDYAKKHRKQVVKNSAMSDARDIVGGGKDIYDSASKNMRKYGGKCNMGGLSRSKDYGSKSKPYPSVKSGDFAGGHRSYPIPTKTDAIDALRLAGLHGRSDVRAKVYAKYPDLRKKSKSGGLYSVTVNGETKLKMFPSTGSLPQIRRKAVLGTVSDDEYETDMSTTNNKPVKTTTLKEIVITPKNVEDETEKRIAKNEKRNRLINSYLSGYHGDAINLLSNIGGNIATTLINKRALNKMQAPPQPISQAAAKLRTNYNINPQLDNLRETAARYEEAVNNNTASSRTALARNQQNRFATALNTNSLYGTKENEETKLINADRLNQQEVANKNVEAYNAWQDKVNAFKNAITEKKAENLVGLTQGITSGITSTIENVQQRMRDDKSILANALSHPNLPIEEFYHNGLISKRAYDAYRKAYPLKADTKKEG